MGNSGVEGAKNDAVASSHVAKGGTGGRGSKAGGKKMGQADIVSEPSEDAKQQIEKASLQG